VPQTGLEPVTPSLRITDSGLTAVNDDERQFGVYPTKQRFQGLLFGSVTNTT
jgi:hypothetical protein